MGKTKNIDDIDTEVKEINMDGDTEEVEAEVEDTETTETPTLESVDSEWVEPVEEPTVETPVVEEPVPTPEVAPTAPVVPETTSGISMVDMSVLKAGVKRPHRNVKF